MARSSPRTASRRQDRIAARALLLCEQASLNQDDTWTIVGVFDHLDVLVLPATWTGQMFLGVVAMEEGTFTLGWHVVFPSGHIASAGSIDIIVEGRGSFNRVVPIEIGFRDPGLHYMELSWRGFTLAVQVIDVRLSSLRVH